MIVFFNIKFNGLVVGIKYCFFSYKLLRLWAVTSRLTHVWPEPEEPLSCRRAAIPASPRRRGTQSVKRRCRAKYGCCYTRLIIRLKMIPYYFAPPELRFWVAGGMQP